MEGFQGSDTMPKFGHVTDLCQQWLVRADGALAHRLQDREISSHLCENRCRNQLIREDFPVALNEQRGIEHELRLKEQARRRQAEIDAEIAREMAEINLRRQRRHYMEAAPQPCTSRAAPPAPPPPQDDVTLHDDINPEELGLSPAELEEMRKRLEQEEKDARLARELSNEVQNHDILLADRKVAVEEQDGELARLLQEREYKKLQRAKERARQKALLKKQQKQAAQQQLQHQNEFASPQTTLCDAYSNPRDLIRENNLRLCKSVDSDLNYIEPFEKETIESKATALQSMGRHRPSNCDLTTPSNGDCKFYGSDWSANSLQHRQPPPPPMTGKKPRFPDPISIRPASHYPMDADNESPTYTPIANDYSENNNLYSTAFPLDSSPSPPSLGNERVDTSKRLSVISDITAEGLAKKKSKQEAKKRKGCKIQ